MASAVTETLVGIAITLGSGGILAIVAYLRKHAGDHEDTHARLARIEAEFQPNGGTSARDLQEDILTAIRHLTASQGIHPPPRRSRPRRHEE